MPYVWHTAWPPGAADGCLFGLSQRIDVLGWVAQLSVRFPLPFVRSYAGRNGSEVWPLAPAKFVAHFVLERAEVVADPLFPDSRQYRTPGATPRAF
jgi:hypothetical protein